MEIILIIAYDFEILVFLITCVFLLIAAYQDLKLRLVDGYIWLILFILVIPVSLVRIILYWNNPNLLVFILLSIIIGVIIALFMLIFGLWGGADILALLCLVLVSPISFELIGGVPDIYNTNYLQLILPIGLTIVMNAALLQAPLPLIIGAKNYIGYKKHPERYQVPNASPIKKIFASFLGEPLPLNTILTKPLFYYQVLETNKFYKQSPDLTNQFPVPFIRLASEPLLRWKQFRRSSVSTLQPNKVLNSRTNSPFRKSKIVDKEWSFDFSIGLKSEEEDLFRQRTIIQQATTRDSLQRHYLWVQYSIPFLVPMLIGYILAFNNINILFLLLKFVHLL